MSVMVTDSDAIIIDRCFCGKKHRKGSTQAQACHKKLITALDVTPRMPLMLDVDDSPTDAIGGTDVQ